MNNDQIPQPPTPVPMAPMPPAPQTPNPYGQPPKKNTGLIVGIIAGVVLLLAAAATILAITLSNKDDTTKKDSDKSSSKDDKKSTDDTKKTETDDAKKRAANSKTAAYMSDLDTVCDTGSVTNAAAYTAPYKVTAFSKDSTGRSWSQVSLKYDAPYAAKYDAFASVNVVACITEKSGSAVKTTTCDYKSGEDPVSIDYYATTYDVNVYEAKSGKKIKNLGTVSGPATDCPSYVSYNKANPKIVAKPDANAVDALIAQFAQ